MNKTELKKLKDLLLKKRLALRSAERHLDDGIKSEAENRSGDSTDIAEADYEQEKSLFMKTRTQDELRLINSALERIEQGDYGECSQCGDEIPTKRLAIQPYSLLCIECQEEKERQESGTLGEVSGTRKSF